jgi:hypothetical protein
MSQSKITNKDFQKFDINPDAILRGEDKRTTVMLRHLHQKGLCSSQDVLLFLERCGLGNRYSFFYMPCKDHSNVPAGFAFLNFASPHDVRTLHDAVKRACGRSLARPPAVSYARFQGHEDLLRHFSVSAVLQEQNPEKRPIFRPEVLSRSNGVSNPMKALGIPGPPGLVDDAEVPSHAAPAVEKGASAVLSSKQLQDLLREGARGETQEATEENTSGDREQFAAFQDERSPKDSVRAEDPRSLKKVTNMVSYVGGGRFEAIYSRLVGPDVTGA